MASRTWPIVATMHETVPEMASLQCGQDPSSHVNNSVPGIVFLVPLSPGLSLFKEHQGEETQDGEGHEQTLGLIFPT